MVLLAEAPSLPKCWTDLLHAGDLILAGVTRLQGPPTRACAVGWDRVALERCWASAWHHKELQLPQHGCGPECGSSGHTTTPHGCHLGERKATGETCSSEIMEKTNALSPLGFFCISFQWDRIWMSSHHPCMLLKSIPHTSPFPPDLVPPLCPHDIKTYLPQCIIFRCPKGSFFA